MIALILDDNVLALLADDAVFDGQNASDSQTRLEGINPAATKRYSCRLKSEAPAEGPWTLDDLEDDPAFALEAMRSTRLGQLLANINTFIERKPDGTTRYDTNLKLNLMKAGMDALAAGQPKPASVVAVETWIAAVQGEYFALKGLLASASTADEIGGLDISYNSFENKFGVNGSVNPDPDVNTSQLLG